MAIVMLDILICKARVPVGRIILELPAGMLDDDKGDFVGTAVREVYFSLPLIHYLFLFWYIAVLKVHVLWPFSLVCLTFLFVFPSDVTVLNYIIFLVFMTMIGWRRDWYEVKCRRHGWPHCFPWLCNWMQSFPFRGVFLSLLPKDLIALFAFSNFMIRTMQIFVIIWHGNMSIV